MEPRTRLSSYLAPQWPWWTRETGEEDIPQTTYNHVADTHLSGLMRGQKQGGSPSTIGLIPFEPWSGQWEEFEGNPEGPGSKGPTVKLAVRGPWVGVSGLTRRTVPSGLRSSMLPRTGKGFPAAAQLIRGIVFKLNSSSEAMSRIWGIRSRERKDTHPGAATGQTHDYQSAPHLMSCISVDAPPPAQSLKPESQ